MVLGTESRVSVLGATGSPLALFMTFSDVSLNCNAVRASIGEMRNPIPTQLPLRMDRHSSSRDNKSVPSSRLRVSPASFAAPNRSPSP